MLSCAISYPKGKILPFFAREKKARVKPEFFVYLAEIIVYESGPQALGLISAAAAAKAASGPHMSR
jgi:hypothetical protein